MNKKFHIITFGCQMNVYDSRRLKSILISMGYSLTEKPADADVIVLNTCCVREHAENRAMGRLAGLSKFKQKNPDVILAMVGCSAQKSGEKLLKKAPYLDLVLGTSQIFNLPDYLSQDAFAENRKRFPVVCLDDSDLFFSDILPKGKNQFVSYVAISRGCDNYCSYCIVPYVRGPEKHRKWEQILKEVQCLAELGCLEVSLIGQNVNSYRDGECDFPDLLQKVNDQTDIKRIKFMTSHPKDLSEKLMEKMSSLPKVCEHLHLPLQSGSNEILKKMNRGYTSEEYLTLVEKAKKKIDNLSITTDLIVGFSGETEKDFEGTLNLVKMVEFDSSFMFRYSSREGTRAAKFEDDVPEVEKLKRLNILIQLQKEISFRKNKKLIGKVEEVLIDAINKRDEKSWKGKSRGNRTVIVKDEKDLLGSIIPVKIVDSDNFTLFGELVH